MTLNSATQPVLVDIMSAIMFLRCNRLIGLIEICLCYSYRTAIVALPVSGKDLGVGFGGPGLGRHPVYWGSSIGRRCWEGVISPPH